MCQVNSRSNKVTALFLSLPLSLPLSLVLALSRPQNRRLTQYKDVNSKPSQVTWVLLIYCYI